MNHKQAHDDDIHCLKCGKEIEHVDTTYSNINTARCKAGQKTGDIYACEECDLLFLDNHLRDKLEPFYYD